VGIAVIDPEGTAILHPGPRVQACITALRDRQHVAAALAGEVGSRVVLGAGGDDLLAAFGTTRAGWAVLVLQPISEAFGPVRRDVAFTGALLAGSMGMAVAVGWLLSGRLAELYARSAAAGEMAERSAEEERAARADAELAARARDELLALASHDLLNPLSAIKVQIQVLRRRLDRDGRIGPRSLGGSVRLD